MAQSILAGTSTMGPAKNLITGVPETFPRVTQSEVQVWANGNTIFAAYNDSTGRLAIPVCIMGGPRLTDGGTTRTNTHPFCASGRPDEPGRPDDRLRRHALGVAALPIVGRGGTPSCGGQESAFGAGRTTARLGRSATARTSELDDRESMWVDNAPRAPFYGRVYVTWNGPRRGSGPLLRVLH